MTPPIQSTILFVGDDAALTYLIERYAQRSGLHVEQSSQSSAEHSMLEPIVVWFASIESLAAFQSSNLDRLNDDTPWVVCSSVADETRARELGADHCVLHPLTYPDFLTALSAVGVTIADAERRPSALRADDIPTS